MFLREKYLYQIRTIYDVDLIKALTGIRRCGKSVVLRQIIDEIKEKGVREDHIIYMNIESKEYTDIRNDDDLYEYIKSKMIDQDKYYIFLDEIHRVTKVSMRHI